MPDGMTTPEKPGIPVSASVQAIRQLGPSLEQISKFRIGAPTKLVGQEPVLSIPQPEWKAEIPQPEMRVRGFGDEEKDPKKAQQERAMLENYMRHMGREEESLSYVGVFIENIRLLEKIKEEDKEEEDKEKDKIRERIAEAYLHINHVELDEIETVNGFLERLRNGFPYDTRWSIQMFEQLEKRVNGVLREQGTRRIEGEGKALLKMYKRDLRWAIAITRISEAMGPAYELYYDGELELQRLRTPHGEILASDFIRAYKKELKGLEPTLAEKDLLKKTLSKLPQAYVEQVDTEDERYKNLKEKSLREVAVEYQDAFGHWSLAATAAGQKNLESGFADDLEAREHYMDIDGIEFRFLNEVFDANSDVKKEGRDLVYINAKGERFKVKASILNPFCMPRDDELAHQAYQARMHELIVNSDHYKETLNRIRAMLEGTDAEILAKEKELVVLANKVVQQADKQINNWESLDENNPYDRLAYIVISNQNSLETGLLSSGDLGWRWEYERVNLDKLFEEKFGELKGNERTEAEKKWRLENQKIIQMEEIEENKAKKKVEFIVKRKSELGSIYDNHDITTVMFWARHIVDYDTMADTRGTLLFPTIGWYRELWENQPPYWRPRVEDFAKDDHLLLTRLGLEGKAGILSDKSFLEGQEARKVYIKGKKGWQSQYYGKFDEGVKTYIKENMWAFVTCWLNKPGKGGNEYNLVFPVFLPTMIEDINFWRSVTLKTPSAKIKDFPRESIWHERLKGAALSAMNWENMPKYKYNWTLVNMDQWERVFGPLVTPHQFNKFTGEEYRKHYFDPSGMAEKEGGKRERLGPRGSKWKQGIIRAISSQFKVLSSIPLSTVMGSDISSLKSVDDKSTGLKNALDEWRYKWIAPWVNVLLDMPSHVVGVQNYPGTAAQCLLVSYLQARPIVGSAIIQSDGQKGDVNKSIANLEKISF